MPSITVTKVEIEKILQTKHEKKMEQETLPIPLKVPKGYLLIPEHQVPKKLCKLIQRSFQLTLSIEQ